MDEFEYGRGDEHNAPGITGVWLRELSRFWDHYNWEYLDRAMTAPSFRISPDSSRLGSWNREYRILSISHHHILKNQWIGVMETLRHEMAHQYVDEVMGITTETAHGPAFRRACRLLRVSPNASGMGGEVTPLSGAAANGGDGAIRDKIAKLLSLATSPNEHEAQSAMQKARHLLLKYNLSLQDLPGTETQYGMRQLGELKSRWQRWEYSLGGLLTKYFFVQTLWSFGFDAQNLKRGSAMLVHGSPVNLDMAEYVFEFLNGLLPRLWADYQRQSGNYSNRGRLHFFWGVLVGFDEKLSKQSNTLARENALVWTGDRGLQEFYRYLHPRIQKTSPRSVSVHESFEDGRSEGRSITLHKPVESRGGSTRGLLSS